VIWEVRYTAYCNFYTYIVRPCPQKRLWPIARNVGNPCLKCSVCACW